MLQLLGPMPPRAHALQQKSLQWEALCLQLEGNPHSQQLRIPIATKRPSAAKENNKLLESKDKVILGGVLCSSHQESFPQKK